MHNVLAFLERVGQDYQLRHAEPAMLADALTRAGIDTGLHQAILDSDSRRLQALLDLPANLCCMVHPGHEEEEDEDPDEDEDEEDDEDDDFDDDEDFDDDDDDVDDDDDDEDDAADGDEDD